MPDPRGEPLRGRRPGATAGGPPTTRLVARAVLAAFSALAACTLPNRGPGGVPPFDIRRTSGSVELEARVRSVTRQPKTQDREDDVEKERIFRETLRIGTSGHIYHPNLLTFEAEGAIGLLQDRFHSSLNGVETDASSSRQLNEYDVSLNLLSKSSLPFGVFARRTEDVVRRPFAASEIQTLEERGGYWNYLSPKTPIRVSYTSRDLTFDPLSRPRQPRSKNSSELRAEFGYHFDEDHEASLEFSDQKVSEQPFDIRYKTREWRLRDRWRFGADKRSRFETFATVYDQTGTVQLKRRQVREMLELQHTENLKTRYEAEWTDRSQTGLNGSSVDDTTWRLSAGIEHKLYQSLVSQLTGFVERQDLGPQGRIERSSLGARFDYRKTNPWGVLTADLGLETQRHTRQGGGEVRSVIDEPHTFQDPQPIVLTDPNVDAKSIVITDITGLTLYKKGIDYKIVHFAQRIRIFRIVTGNIANGETVLLDYDIVSDSDFTLDTQLARFGIRQTFDFGLAPYYRFEKQDQGLSGGGTQTTLVENITSNTFGIEYTRGGFHALGEFQKYESNLAPFRRTTFSASIDHRFDFDASASLGGTWSRVLWQPPIQRQRTSFNIDGVYEQEIGEHLSFTSTLRYLRERDTEAGNDDGIGADFSLLWNYRRLELRVALELGRFENDFARTDSSFLVIQLKRRF